MKTFFKLTFNLSLLAACALSASHDKGSRPFCAHKDIKWDYIIVGDGTAGATLAAKLSDNRKNKVLVLEWGENRTDDPVVLEPNPLIYSLTTLVYDPRYAVNPIMKLTFPDIAEKYFIYSDGRMWGGSSAHNGMVAVRGTPSLYDEWAEAADSSLWSYDSLLPLMKYMEKYVPNGTIADPSQRGLRGPVTISQSPPINDDPFSIAVSLATDTPFVPDYNNPNYGDVGISANQQFSTPPVPFVPPFSHRTFSANTFQKTGVTVDENGNGLNGRQLKIISKALVGRVLFEGNKAIGVEATINGEESVKFYAKRKVILSAGTLKTAAILERSGIGDRNLLESLGIPVIVDNPHVGEHLQNHYGVGGVFVGATTSAFPFLEGFTDNLFNDGRRRIQLISINVPGAVLLYGILLNPQSKGSSHIVSTDPTIESYIEYNLFSDGSVNDIDSDAYNAVTYLKQLPQIAAQTGSLLVAPSPAAYAAGDAALLAYSEDLANLFITYHLTSSCRMAESMADGVVNSRLHVFGTKNLMCADCSIEPRIQDGNTGYSAFIIGLNAARILKNLSFKGRCE